MELKLLQDNGQLGAGVAASPEVFGRDYNEALVHQVVVAYQANARSGNRKQKDREEVKHTTKKPWRQKGTGRARAGMSSSPLWRGGGRIFPNSPEENFSQKVNKKMYRAGMRSIYSQLAREGRINVVDSLSVDAPKTKLLADKFRAMGLDSVLVTKAAVADRGVAEMTQVAKNDHRLMQVLLAPVVSEKATLVAEKNEQVVFEVARDANKGEVKAAVELLFKVEVESVQILNQKGKQKRFGRFMGRRDT